MSNYVDFDCADCKLPEDDDDACRGGINRGWDQLEEIVKYLNVIEILHRLGWGGFENSMCLHVWSYCLYALEHRNCKGFMIVDEYGDPHPLPKTLSLEEAREALKKTSPA